MQQVTKKSFAMACNTGAFLCFPPHFPLNHLYEKQTVSAQPNICPHFKTIVTGLTRIYGMFQGASRSQGSPLPFRGLGS